jgi:hypothetical protein
MAADGPAETWRDELGTWVTVAPFRAADLQGRELARAVLAAPAADVKDDTKRAVRRHTLPDGRQWIVKYYRLTRWWLLCPWFRHDRRCWETTRRLADLGFPVARCLAWLRRCDGSGCIIMEDAGTARLRPSLLRLPAAEAQAVAADTARLFAALHQRGIFHADLKPGNLLLQPAGAAGGRIRLIDCDQVWFRRPITPALRRRNLGQFVGSGADRWLTHELIQAFLDAYLAALPAAPRRATEGHLAAAPLA